MAQDADLSFSANDGDVCCVCQMIVLEATVLAFGCFLRILCQEVTSRRTSRDIHKTCNGYGASVPSRVYVWDLIFEMSIIGHLKPFSVDTVLGVFAVARSYKVSFNVKGCLG